MQSAILKTINNLSQILSPWKMLDKIKWPHTEMSVLISGLQVSNPKEPSYKKNLIIKSTFKAKPLIITDTAELLMSATTGTANEEYLPLMSHITTEP